MSSGWMLDEIIMNLYRKNTEKQNIEFLHNFFTRIKGNNIILYIVTLQYYT